LGQGETPFSFLANVKLRLTLEFLTICTKGATQQVMLVLGEKKMPMDLGTSCDFTLQEGFVKMTTIPSFFMPLSLIG